MTSYGVDIDLFKAVNDACAARKRSGGDIVARFGGEEFVIVRPETDGASALHVAESLRREGACTGFEALLNQADLALYRAKQTGRNAVYCAEVPRGDAMPARWARYPQDDTGGARLS